MPADRTIETVYLGKYGSYDNFNESSLYKAGELGLRAIDTLNRQYQLVQLDSGATASTSAGVAAANQVAYWKDKSNYIVTNDSVQAIGGQGANSQFRNEIAGVIRNAVTAGNFCFVLQQGRNINVKTKASTYIVGDWVVGDTTTAQADAVTAGTAPTVQSIGKAAAVRSGANVAVDLCIPGIP